MKCKGIYLITFNGENKKNEEDNLFIIIILWSSFMLKHFYLYFIHITFILPRSCQTKTKKNN